MEIIWTEESLNSYLKIIDYLFERWSAKEIIELEIQVETLLKNLIQYQAFCPVSKLAPYRKCVLNPHTSLIYLINNHQIILITFLHNKSAHNY